MKPRTDIPKRLAQHDLLYYKIERESKQGFEKKWNKASGNTYTDDDTELQTWLNTGNNYGVLTGYNDLLVVDFDDEEAHKKLAPCLPETFVVESGSGGYHYYYFCSDMQSKQQLVGDEDEVLVDLQYNGCGAVGPGSTHPNGEAYSVENNHEITEISVDDLRRCILDVFGVESIPSDWQPSQQPRVDRQEDNEIVDKIRDEITVFDITSIDSPGVYSAPYREDSNPSFSVNQDGTKWNDFGLDEGGDVFSLYAKLNDYNVQDDFPQIIEELGEKAGIDVEKHRSRGNTGNSFFDVHPEWVKWIRYSGHSDKPGCDRGKAAKAMATAFLNRNDVVTLRNKDEESYIYEADTGLWNEHAESYIKQYVLQKVGSQYSQRIANEVVNRVKLRTFIEPDTFHDVRPRYVCVKNGVVDLKERDENERLLDFSPRYYHTTKLPVTYDPEASCDEIDEFFKDLVKEDTVPLLYEIAGFMLYRDYFLKKAFMLVGNGDNGKTQYLNVMTSLIGQENITGYSLHRIMDDKFARGNLWGSYANIAGELNSKTLRNTDYFKRATGDDTLDADIKHSQEKIQFYNYAKMMFSANTLPKTEDLTDGFFTRWKVIDFPYQFKSESEYDGHEQDENIKQAIPSIADKIVSETELSGLLNKAISGLHNLLDDGEFTESESVKQTKEKWIRKSDTFHAFLRSHVEQSSGSLVLKSDIRQAYRWYCDKHSVEPDATNRHMTNLLQSKFTVGDPRKQVNGEQKYFWKGIKLSEDIEMTQSELSKRGLDDTYSVFKNSVEVDDISLVDNTHEDFLSKSFFDFTNSHGSAPLQDLVDYYGEPLVNKALSQPDRALWETDGSVSLEDRENLPEEMRP